MTPIATGAAQAQATHWLAPHGPARAAVLLLHGLDMTPEQLVPFVDRLRLPAWVAVPAGPVARPGGGRAWWPVDDLARAGRLAGGPSDLHDSDPPGREPARLLVRAVAALLRARAGSVPLVVAGFSQGAMLALDTVLRPPGLAVDALALWSASRLAWPADPHALRRLRGLPVDLRHGRSDLNLGLEAARALHEALVEAGACVSWSPFEGGHEIPLSAWVGLRRLVRCGFARGA